MATLQNSYELDGYRVVHPLEDAPEQKCETEGGGPMVMRPGVRLWLMVLRGYLILVTLMLVWDVLPITAFASPATEPDEN